MRREGVQWLWMALDPGTKGLPTLHLGPRTPEAARQFVPQGAQGLAPGWVPAFTTDGWRANGKRMGRFPMNCGMASWSKAKARLSLRACGWPGDAGGAGVRKAQGFKTLIQTAFVERVNLTLRRGIAPLMRKTWAYAQTTVPLHLHVEWWRAYYHTVRPHESLGQKGAGLRRPRLRSPGMAAGLTARLWTVGEHLRLPLWPEIAR